ncbi:MAG: winged helix-turn-helix domain-containing protein [Reyranellaceae bacterium]
MLFRFENFVLDAARRELLRDGAPVAVEPQVFDLLLYLIENRERVVSKDEVLTAVWRGRIVSESTLTTRINAARKALVDSGEAQRLIRTLPRKGMRFVGEVWCDATTTPPALGLSAPDLPAAVAPTSGALPLPDRPSIAVLAFENRGGSPEQEYFADGIAEDIIVELSRYKSLFTIARNSSFTYKGRAVDVKRIGRELGVGYVLEGSVRRAGPRIRVTAQLIDACSGAHVWAERYDSILEDIFAIQDEITRCIVSVLPGRLEAAELTRDAARRTAPLDAFDYVLRGKYLHHLENVRANREAEGCFDRAIEKGPALAAAVAWKACTIGQRWTLEFEPRTPAGFDEVVRLAHTALELDENDAECHRIMCRLSLEQRRYERSEHHLDRALGLTPNDPRLLAQRGINLTYLGDAASALPWIEQAMRLDPFSASRYEFDLVRAHYATDRAAEAKAVLDRSTRIGQKRHLWMAACLVDLGAEGKAREEVEKLLAIRPGMSVSEVLQSQPWKRPEDATRIETAMRRAGLPG